MAKDIIVIGTSAGGLEALRTVVGTLPRDLPASLFVVMHTSPDSPAMLAAILDRYGELTAISPENGESIQRGFVYIAPPDRHLVLEPGVVCLTRGPKENRFRPAIDPLFRQRPRLMGHARSA